jgi:molybdopterin biosynthesis enzyme
MPESMPIMTAALLGRTHSAPRAGLPVPLARALAELTEGLAPVPARRLPVADALGAVLASALLVPSPIPSAAVALRRGYAVSSAETLGAGPYSPLPLLAVPLLVEAGQILPPGTDAVLPEDAITRMADRAEAQDSAAPGAWARRVGEDAPQDAVLRKAGEQVRAVDLALARAANLSTCQIRGPRMLLVGAGPESAAALELLGALARSAGAEVRIDRKIGDAEADLVCAVGNGSLLDALAGQGARVLAQRLALRPGEDGAALRLGGIPILLVPERLADALGLWLGLALPILRHLSAATPALRREGRLGRKLSSTIGVSELALLRRTGDGFEPLATGDLPFAAISAADAWLMIPPESEGFAAGEVVHAEHLSP